MSVPHGVGKSRGDQVDQDWQRSHVTVLVLIASVSQEHLCRFPDIAAFSCSCKGPHQKSAFTCSSLVFHVFTSALRGSAFGRLVLTFRFIPLRCFVWLPYHQPSIIKKLAKNVP